jgi:ABC-type transport system substrate-binding protein
MKKIISLVVLTIAFTFVIYFRHDLFDGKIKKEEINLSLSSEVKTLDPAIAFNDDALMLLNQSMETLYQYHYLKPYNLLPLLAKDLPKISNDGLLWTIKLKKGIFYQEHRCFEGIKQELRSEDFVLAIKRIAFKPLKSTGRWLFQNKLEGFNRFAEKVGDDFEKMISTTLEGVKIIDDYTFSLQFKKPIYYLNYFFTMTFLSPTPLKVLKCLNNDLSKEIIGTGPYQYLGLKDGVYVFEANPRFHEEYYPESGDRYSYTHKLLKEANQKIPFLKKINFKVIADKKNSWEQFNKGEIDIITVPNEYMENYYTKNKKSKNLFQIKLFSKLNIRWLGFNMKDPVVGKNKFLRLAIAHAIDRDQYNIVQSGQTSQVANSIYHPSLEGYSPTKKLPFEYNLEMAREFLIKAGYPEGKGLPELEYASRGLGEDRIAEAHFFKEQLAKIGIKVKIKKLSFSKFLIEGRAGKLQLWTDNWYLDYPDASNILQMLRVSNHPGINKSAYHNPEFEKLLMKYLFSSDEIDKVELLGKLEDIVLNDLPWVMLLYENAYIVHNPKLRNFRKSYIIRNFIKYLKFE